MVHRLKRHPGGDSPIADDANGAPLFAFFSAAIATPIPAEIEVEEWPTLSTSFAFAAPRERMQPAFLADSADFVAAASENFVRVIGRHPKLSGRTAYCRHGAAPRSVQPCQGQRQNGRLSGSRCPEDSGAAHRKAWAGYLWQQAQLGGIYQRQGWVFGNIKTHQRLIYCLFIALNNVIRERFQCRIQRLQPVHLKLAGIGNQIARFCWAVKTKSAG